MAKSLTNLCPSSWEGASKSLEFSKWLEYLCYLWWALIVYADEATPGGADHAGKANDVIRNWGFELREVSPTFREGQGLEIK